VGKAEVDQPLLYQSGFMSTRPAELQGKRDLVTVPYGAKGADGGSAQRLTSSDGRDEAKGDRAFEGVRVKRVTYHRSGMGVGHWSTPAHPSSAAPRPRRRMQWPTLRPWRESFRDRRREALGLPNVQVPLTARRC
jgi:hypothetical protein